MASNAIAGNRRPARQWSGRRTYRMEIMSSVLQHDVVIVGTGLAGFSVASELARLGYSGSVALVGDEPWQPYDRPPLSKRYQIDGNDDAIRLGPELPPAITQLLGCAVSQIDVARTTLRLLDGRELAWRKLVIATGARPRTLPQLQDSPRVRTLRTLDDARAIRSALKPGGSLLVVGAGPIGLELAATSAELGVKVTVVEMATRVMSRSVPALMADAILAHHRTAGLAIHLGRTVALLNDRSGEAVLDDGQRVPADLLVVGVGVVANDGIASQAGIACDDGILVDGFGRTSAQNVFAAGDVTRQRHPRNGRLERVETWSNAQGQGRTVAAFLADPAAAKPHDMVPWFWSDQGDIRLQCAGDTAGEVQAWRQDPSGGRILAQWTRGRLTGVAALNAPRDFVQLKRLIVDRTTITPQQLMSGAGVRELVQQGLAG